MCVALRGQAVIFPTVGNNLKICAESQHATDAIGHEARAGNQETGLDGFTVGGRQLNTLGPLSQPNDPGAQT